MPSLALLRWNRFVLKLLETGCDETNTKCLAADGVVEYASALAAADTAAVSSSQECYTNTRLSFILGKCEWRLSNFPRGRLGKSNDNIEKEEWKNSSQVKQPEIRMWGTTESGQKLCLHLWGVIPYFHFRPMNNSTSSTNNCERRSSLLMAFLNNDETNLKRMLPELESSIKAVMKSRRTQRITAHLNLTVEFLTDFYGFNSDEEIFVRVNILNPAHIKPLVEELVIGNIFGVCFQPFGAHVSYLMQAFVDYNLAGFSPVHFSHARFRLPLPEPSVMAPTAPGDWLVSSTPTDMIWEDAALSTTDELLLQGIVKSSHRDLLKMRKSPVREASCELEADAHVLSLLIDYKNRSETAAAQFEKAKKRRRHLVPESTVPSLDMLWEEEKLRRGKVKNSSSSSTTPLMQSEAAISPMTNAPADEAMRNVSIGNGFITCPKLLRSNKKGTVLHRMEQSLYHMVERYKSSLSSSAGGIMTQEMCEDIDFLTERRGGELVVYNNAVVDRGRGCDDLLRSSNNKTSVAAASATETATADEDKEEERWNSSSPPLSEDESSTTTSSEEAEMNDKDLWKAIHESQLEISQSSSSPQCATPPPEASFCEEKEIVTNYSKKMENESENQTPPYAAPSPPVPANVVIDSEEKDEGESGSPVVVTLESFLDEEVMVEKNEDQQQIGGHYHCDMDSPQKKVLPPPCDAATMLKIPSPRIKEKNNEDHFEGTKGEEQKQQQQQEEMSSDEGELSSRDPMVEISVETTGNEVMSSSTTNVWFKPLINPPPPFSMLPMSPSGFHSVAHTPVHYTVYNDILKMQTRMGFEGGGHHLKRKSCSTVKYWGDVKEFETGGGGDTATANNPPSMLKWIKKDSNQQCKEDNNRVWLESSLIPPPSQTLVADWLKAHPAPSYPDTPLLLPNSVPRSNDASIQTPFGTSSTQNVTLSPNSKFGLMSIGDQYTMLSLEIHAQGELMDKEDVAVASPADPEMHPVVAVAWCFRDVWGTNESESIKEKHGVIYVKRCTDGSASIDVDRDETILSAICNTCGVRKGGDSCLCEISFFRPRPRPLKDLPHAIDYDASKCEDPDLPGEPLVHGLGLKLIPHGLVEDKNRTKHYYYYFMKDSRQHADGSGLMNPLPSQEMSRSSATAAVENDVVYSEVGSEKEEEENRQKNTRSDDENVNRRKDEIEVVCCDSEVQLFFTVILLVRRLDPDFLVGWEVMNASIGYLVERARAIKVVPDMLTALSRVPLEPHDPRNDHDAYGRAHTSGIYISGRTVLNLWRICRSELKLPIYTRECVAKHCLKRRTPCFACSTKRQWYFKGGVQLGKLLSHEVSNGCLNLDIIAGMDFVGKTAAIARILGIEFNDVLSRGSQFRVESVLLRTLKKRKMVPLSPTLKQVKGQDSPECIPLVMEPKAGFYEDPVVVLDFQSLYPSMMIAYNLCFSTILGRLMPGAREGKTIGKLGVLDMYPEERTIQTVSGFSEQQLANSIFVAPNGALFIHSRIREGVLPTILREVLAARLMVKRAVVDAKKEGKYVAARNLNAKQLALKLIANVTYGYTAASFTGRMPMAELADAIVHCGRSTLESAVQLVESNDAWGAEVVYGDTDSMFVLLRGRSLSEAFKIGNEIAHAVTSANPSPVKLKLEKVYAGSVMVTKKRYAGLAYDSGPDSIPYFDGKGIEAIRRDQCPLTRKLQERCLMELFTTRDASRIKKECFKTWQRVYSGRGGIKDFIFSHQVRQHYKNDKLLPPAAVVHARWNRGSHVLHNQRVRYVVVCGAPNTPIREVVVAPEEIMAVGSSLRINSNYYVTKQLIPALDRVLSLAGLDVSTWEKQQQVSLVPSLPPLDFHVTRNGQGGGGGGQNRTITQFFQSDHCRICGEISGHPVCKSCCALGIASSVGLYRLNRYEHTGYQLLAVCQNCTGHCLEQLWAANECCSQDCPVFFMRYDVAVQQDQAKYLCNVAEVNF